MQIRSLSSDLASSIPTRTLSGFDQLGSAGFASLLQQSQATAMPVPPEPAAPPPPPPAPAPLPSPNLAHLPVQPPAPVARNASSAPADDGAPSSPQADTAANESAGSAVDSTAGHPISPDAAPAGRAPGGSTRARPKAGDSATATKDSAAAKAARGAKAAPGDAADTLAAGTAQANSADAATAPAGSTPGSAATATPSVPVTPPVPTPDLPTPTASTSTDATSSATDSSTPAKTTASIAGDASRRIDLGGRQELDRPGITAAGGATADDPATAAPRPDAGFAAVLAEHRDGGSDGGGAAGSVDGAGAASPSAAAFGASPAAPAGAAPAVDVPTPVASPDFARHLGTQLSVLAKGGVQQAELHLNPADMGPVSVQITLDGTQARIDFGADVAATRHAIEAGLPQLAGALADAGLTLAGGGVSQHAGGRGEGGAADRRNAEPGGTARSRAVDPAAAGGAGTVVRRNVRIGGLDLYA